MLTRLVVRNFKTLEAVDIELGQNVVFIGQNNSGKTSALQALALWQTAVREWFRRRRGTMAKERSGVTINRRALFHTPVPETRLLWRDLRFNTGVKHNGEPGSQFVFIDVLVEGQTRERQWSCGFEFYYANPESIYCRPLRLTEGDRPARMPVPEDAEAVRIAFLPPMSGLVSEEPELQTGRIDVLIGEGQTAQVLRNLCLQVFQKNVSGWQQVKDRIRLIFGVDLNDPVRDNVRGSISLTYSERSSILDISSGGRGLQQSLLLLTHIFSNPGSTLLLDEPDAHLEVLRQREIYNIITESAQSAGSQVIVASHSEVILNEAADRDLVIAFVGRPHRLNDRGSQVLKALREIGYDQYFQAQLRRGVLYLEGATDLAILLAIAERFKHDARKVLRDPFVKYVGNQPQKALDHYFALREAKPDLSAFAIFDRLERGMPPQYPIPSHAWSRREIENFLTSKEILQRFATTMPGDDLFADALRKSRGAAMTEAIFQVEGAFATLGNNPWSNDAKSSDEVLPAIFRNFYQKLSLKNELDKADFHSLAQFMTDEDFDPELRDVLDCIVRHLGPPVVEG